MKRNGIFIVSLLAVASLALAFLPLKETASNKLVSHGETVIAEDQNGDIVIVMNETTLANKWEVAVANGGESIDFDAFEIAYDGLNEQYLLLGNDASNEKKAAIPLVKIENDFYEELTQAGAGRSVVCKGCVLACHPLIVGGLGYCNPDCISPNTCTKTETLTSGSILD